MSQEAKEVGVILIIIWRRCRRKRSTDAKVLNLSYDDLNPKQLDLF